MQPKGNGRYCGSCQKIVVDYTTKTNEEISEHIRQNYGKQLCGTFKDEQLSPSKLNQTDENAVRFLAALLLVFGMSLFSCSSGSLQSIDLGDTIKTHEVYSRTTIGIIVIPPHTITREVECRSSSFSANASDTSTEKYHYDNKTDTNKAVIMNLAEIMPQFNNRGQTLPKFIKNNLNYPSTTENNTGTVYISFVVMQDGSIEKIEVFKGFNKPFDEAALEVVKLMPNWKPGENKGKKVNVRMYLPIKFRPSKI